MCAVKYATLRQRNRPSTICSWDMRHNVGGTRAKAEMKVHFFLSSGMETPNVVLLPSTNSKILLNNICIIIIPAPWAIESFLAPKVFQMHLHYWRTFSNSHWPFLCPTYMWPGVLSAFANDVKQPFQISQAWKLSITQLMVSIIFWRFLYLVCWPDEELNPVYKVLRIFILLLKIQYYPKSPD